MRNTFTLIISLVFGVSSLLAQDNELLKRDFWKGQPDLQTIQALVEKGHDPKELNENSFDPMVYAILEKTPVNTLTAMVEAYNIEPNTLTHDGRTYIFWAAYAGNVEFMKYLQENGARMDLKDDHGYTVMNFAASTGQKNKKVYQFCIDHGADPLRETDQHGASALLLYAPNDNPQLEMTKYFQGMGADINGVDEEGNNAFVYAARSGNIDLMKAFQEAGVPPRDEAFLFAVRGSRSQPPAGMEVYSYLESLGLDPAVTSAENSSVLHVMAARSKDRSLLEYFMSKGGDINLADHEGNTPFMLAASRNGLEMVAYFHEKGGNISAANKKGETPFLLAVRNNSAEVVKYLLESGANAQVSDARGDNALVYLMESYNNANTDTFLKKAALLEQEGIQFDSIQENGNTLFHLAVEKHNVELLKWVAGTGADINAVNKDGYTPAHLAAMTAADVSILKYMISLGADTSKTTPFEESLYDLASENEKLSRDHTSLEFLK